MRLFNRSRDPGENRGQASDPVEDLRHKIVTTFGVVTAISAAAMSAVLLPGLDRVAQQDSRDSQRVGEEMLAENLVQTDTGVFLALDEFPQTGVVEINRLLFPTRHGTRLEKDDQPGSEQAILSDTVFYVGSVPETLIDNGHDESEVFEESLSDDGRVVSKLSDRVRECAIPNEPVGNEATMADWRGNLIWVDCETVIDVGEEVGNPRGLLTFTEETGAWRVGGELWGSWGSTIIDLDLLYGGVISNTGGVDAEAIPNTETIARVREGFASTDKRISRDRDRDIELNELDVLDIPPFEIPEFAPKRGEVDGTRFRLEVEVSSPD
jgi:hypothetical protein